MAKYLQQGRKLLIWFLVICIVLLLGAVAVLSLWVNHLQGKLIAMRSDVYALQAQVDGLKKAAAATEPTVPEPSSGETVPDTQPAEVPTLPDAQSQPGELTAMLTGEDITYGQLADMQCTQLITVQAEGSRATIRMFGCEEGLWQELEELECQGFLGRNGTARSKQEGDGCTPLGLYSVGSGFYTKNAPETGLDLFQVTRDTYWVDDPDSQFYNQRVEGTENKDWDSAEHMIDYPEYLYGFVVDYNLAAQKGAGSAIFFHINDNPTAGCIATSEKMVLAYLAQLDTQLHPHILIVSE